ncbi:hypothetical protein J3D43_005704 [Paenibacillus xylanexedens]|uniref:hypothetical protein n=1 Tax=Paenibacillus xylanexedens TaxID=528191 RepID=UPI00209C8A56|nr:hypothetical protein [Paenibacillus xylanexedens]MCP1427188.1 hypothetical protein [Paenibacillus xylanexedens]
MNQKPKKWDTTKTIVPFQQMNLFDKIKIFRYVSDFLNAHGLGEAIILLKEGNYETILLYGETVYEKGTRYVPCGCDAG